MPEVFKVGGLHKCPSPHYTHPVGGANFVTTHNGGTFSLCGNLRHQGISFANINVSNLRYQCFKFCQDSGKIQAASTGAIHGKKLSELITLGDILIPDAIYRC